MNLPSARDISIRVSDDGSATLAGLPLFLDDDDKLMCQIDLVLKMNRPSLVVTANVDQTLDLSSSAVLWQAYNYASIRTADGMPLVWIARVLGARKAHRQTGADLLRKTAASSKSRGWKIAILGGAPTANDSAVKALLEEFPGADIAGVYMPYSAGLDTSETDSLLHRLKSLRPNLVFICLGSPKQESFFMNLRTQLPPAVYIGAGAAVDFAGGTRRRAPRLFQVLGLEWTWRLAQEPRRLGRRYLVKGAGFRRIIFNSIKGNEQ